MFWVCLEKDLTSALSVCASSAIISSFLQNLPASSVAPQIPENPSNKHCSKGQGQSTEMNTKV